MALTGDFLSFVALVVFLLERTGSAAWVAAVAGVRVVASVVLGSFGGVVADRYPRRPLLLVVHVSRAVTMAATAGAVALDGAPTVVLALSLVTSVLTVPHRPAAVAAAPFVVDEDDLAGANASVSVVAQLTLLLGPALGAGLVALTDPATTLGVNAGLFVLAAVLLTRAGDIGGGRGADDDRHDRVVRATVVHDAREGLRIVGASAGLVAIACVMAVVLLQIGVEQVVHVVLADERLGVGAKGVGLIDAATGLGGLVVVPFTVRIARARSSGLLLATAVVVHGATMVLLAYTESLGVVLVLVAVEGMAAVLIDVVAITVVQRSCPERALARVFGMNDSLSAGTQLLGAVAAPLLLAGPGLSGSLWVTGVVVVVAALLLAPTLHREARAADDERRRLAPMVEMYRALGIFGDASQAALERLARASVARTIEAGEVVFRSGDIPDDLYVIRSGYASVHLAAGREVTWIGPGDWFGEIGLLRGVRRTATVRAEADLDAWVIPGSVFLDALAGGPDALPDPLRLTMTSRLAKNHVALAGAAAGEAT